MRGAASGSSSSPWVFPEERRRFLRVCLVVEGAGVMEVVMVDVMSTREWTLVSSGL